MTDLYELIERIKLRPAMYLGKPYITRLKAFLDGYIGARIDLGFPLKKHEESLNDFQKWIQLKFNINSAHSWADIILFYSLDERDALNKFFELFAQFQSDQSEVFTALVKSECFHSPNLRSL